MDAIHKVAFHIADPGVFAHMEGVDARVFIIKEKVMTHGKQLAQSDFTVDLNGEGCHTNVISRSVARGQSRQIFFCPHGRCGCPSGRSSVPRSCGYRSRR